MIKLLIVDDHAVVRSGLRMLLHGRHGIEVVGEAADGAEAIERAETLRPDMVLMDLSMPGMDGMTAVGELRRRMPGLGLLVLTMHDDDEYLFRAIQQGASGYILKNAPHEELLAAIETVAEGNAYLYPTATKRLMSEYIQQASQPPSGAAVDAETDAVYDKLSEREKEILAWTARGYANKEIAEHLIISVKTVEAHKSNLMEKLGLKSRPELIKFAMKRGLLDYD
ncbi:DNA-binding response regulator [Paenibacillus sp. 598K]|uniref:response regulator n=1 Tax=Paenibacillus sp. 598K TaxID=1117987 RepID=UPI000FF937D5|nr:response regulator transcription factor [Paenibacillus sp. 598K]GBF75216.1 DNA-binding response regulator [Paenibacillus sp. 598K]